jgi:hypothetical protein
LTATHGPEVDSGNAIMGMFKVSRREPDMPPIGKDDAEMSYRRGYEHGAVETFRAVERFLDPATREVLRLWIQEDVHGWRYKAMLGGPPIWRLNMLSDLKPN